MKILYSGFLVILLAAALIGLAMPHGTANAASVTPVLYDPWQSGSAASECAAVGYQFGFKVDNPPSGTYSSLGTGIIGSIVISTDGTYFDWSSTFGIDVVIAKGGNAANVYFYNESYGDTNLNPPNNASGNPAGISHLTFCWDYDPLTASKTANTEWTREYTWDITKTVDDDFHEGFLGDSFTSNYTVGVTQYVDDYGFHIYGNISITNTNPLNVSMTVVDSIDGGIGTVATTCPSTIGAGQTVNCSYEVYPTGTVGTLNTVTVTSGTIGVGSAQATAPVNWGAPNIVGYPSVTVNDTNGMSWGFSSTGSQTYAVTFDCDEDEGDNPNTATIQETGQAANENVYVDCYELSVTKSALTQYTRDYDWSISKFGDQSALTLSIGQVFTVNYSVVVNVTGFTDTDHTVYGTIAVDNPSPLVATINSVSDILSVGGTVPVDCGVVFPYNLAAYSTLNCTYSGGAGLNSSTSGVNTATAVLANNDGGTQNFSGLADYNFNNANITELDTCIDVSDSQYGDLGTVCKGQAPKTFNYSLEVGNYVVCGNYQFINIASFETSDQDGEPDDTGSDDHAVNITVPCVTGCTLTPGYWKTHSKYGPAPSDPDWYNLGDADGDGVSEGPDETFFKSGQTWYQVLWTPPAGGNAYYILAHAYIAARLNIVNGASYPSSIGVAITNSTAFFNTHLPSDKLDKNTRKAVIANADLIDNFNNGLLGTPHCSE